jgi:hypothetical protein
VVHSVDGVPVLDLAHLSALLDRGEGEFVDIVLERGGVITLAREAARVGEHAILGRYGVGADRSADLGSPAAVAR